ncbi:UNKNOWN [Stylonychia lemnae]|uniref:Uncharacterized protein n=1 Tax=Stylonychia lemnae TaxID=5949 RepID=A0A078BDU8_STYLE|nr:UNKNOWN [Stylonychia lemnae]|eukprot:CDW91753.1 UNKNOWN [Stylonychia lemnae]
MGKVANVRIRQFVIENEDKNAIATQNLYAKLIMRYDQDLLSNPHMQVKIIISELRMLKNKASQLKNLLNARRYDVPRVFSYLQKGYQVNFNTKFESITALLINISTVLLQEFAKDPSGIGIPEISYVTEDISQIEDETQAFLEDLDVYILVLKYFSVATDVYIILSCDFERDLPTLSQITNMVRQMAKARYLCSEVMSIYKELSNCYDKKIERIQVLQDQVENKDSLRMTYHQLSTRVDHHVRVYLSPAQKEEIERKKIDSQNRTPVQQKSNPNSKSPKNLRKAIESMKKKKELDTRRENFLQIQIEKNKQRKNSLLKRLQEEMGRFKLDIEEAFGQDRKLCKKNITQRTKYLIEKFQSKKQKKDKDFYTKILRSARDQAQAVRLDYEIDEDKKKNNAIAEESKYYEALHKLKFDANSNSMLNCNNQALNKMKYNIMHGNKGIEKAMSTASKICRSNLLKVGLQYLQDDIDKQKKEISKKKML